MRNPSNGEWQLDSSCNRKQVSSTREIVSGELFLVGNRHVMRILP